MQIVTRKEAKAQGFKRYYTGKPCKNGHVDTRLVSTGRCCACFVEYHRRWREENKDRWASYGAAWYKKNKDRKAEAGAAWIAANKDRRSEKARAWHKAQRVNNPAYRLRESMRDMLKRTLQTKTDRTHRILGYTAQELREHLERQFQSGMSWDNYGEWHIDHIYPIAQFIRDGEDDPAVINALSNLRPTWASENLSKGDRVETLL